MQLGPLEVGVVVATVLACYAIARSAELRSACLDCYDSFLSALRGERTGPTAT